MNTMVAEWPSKASWIVEKSKTLHESQLLKLDISKAKARLGWSPRWNLDRTLQSIIEWHFSWLNKEDMRQITLNQIADYEKTCSNAGS
jgi:CDP-glucose 4,6-dehydratase